MGDHATKSEGEELEAPLDLDNPPFPLTAIDREVLATKDEDYHKITWDDLQEIIGTVIDAFVIITSIQLTRHTATNRLEKLKRLPSNLHKYLRWSFATKKAYGSITNFVVKERLFWTPTDPSIPVSATSFSHHSAVPFQDPRDYAILLNDWPYGFVPGLTHLLIWSRTPIAVDMSRDGDVTPESKVLIEDFVEAMFVRRLAERKGVEVDEARKPVIWFKNWVGLQSVRGVDHVHVIVRDAPEELVREWCVRKDL